ncbi:hypothetical protein F511_34941 [Dorcoceras hygrometricum]|uniref:Uncharacterized protein n=1 Tax=Dorcoceras hygrometricum TaxID=472368 RepID=A0A2Z7DIL9_9LAMI|nr:hypothetical protein F511_34941 [Dorcoceras hygrometricum]
MTSALLIEEVKFSNHDISVADCGQFDEENPFVLISSALLVQPDEGVLVLVVDRIGDYLPQSTEKSRVLVIPVGARHKCQQVSDLVVDRIGVIYRNLPRRAGFL